MRKHDVLCGSFDVICGRGTKSVGGVSREQDGVSGKEVEYLGVVPHVLDPH